MKGDVNEDAIREVLGGLQSRLEAFLTEWRRELIFQERFEDGVVREEERLVATQREENAKG